MQRSPNKEPLVTHCLTLPKSQSDFIKQFAVDNNPGGGRPNFGIAASSLLVKGIRAEKRRLK